MARHGSFLESFAKGFKLGSVIGEYVNKKQDKKKAKELFDKLTKDEELVNNPSKLWSKYASSLVAQGIATPEQAQEMMAKGMQLHVGQLQLQHMKAFDDIKKDLETRINKATKLYEKGNIDEFVRTIKPIIEAQSALPDGRHYQLVNEGGQVRIQAFSDFDGKPIGQPVLVTPETLQPAAMSFMAQMAAYNDPKLLFDFINNRSKADLRIGEIKTNVAANREIAQEANRNRLQTAALNAVSNQLGGFNRILGTMAATGVDPATLANTAFVLKSLSRNAPFDQYINKILGTNLSNDFDAGLEAARRELEKLRSNQKPSESSFMRFLSEHNPLDIHRAPNALSLFGVPPEVFNVFRLNPQEQEGSVLDSIRNSVGGILGRFFGNEEEKKKQQPGASR